MTILNLHNQDNFYHQDSPFYYNSLIVTEVRNLININIRVLNRNLNNLVNGTYFEPDPYEYLTEYSYPLNNFSYV